MTTDIKYPEEISRDEILKKLERLQVKMRRREGKPKSSEREKLTEDIKKKENK